MSYMVYPGDGFAVRIIGNDHSEAVKVVTRGQKRRIKQNSAAICFNCFKLAEAEMLR